MELIVLLKELAMANIETIAQVLSQTLAFFLFFLILRRYAWGPVLGMIDERNAKIEEGFKRAEDAEKRAEELKADYEEHIKNIEGEARDKIRDAVNEGRKTAEEIGETARNEAQKIQQKAAESAQLEIAKARIELKEEIVALVLGASEKMIREKLDEELHRKMVDGFIEELSQKQ